MPLPVIEIKSESLDNGLKFSANESREIDSIALTGSIRAGAIYDKQEKFGTAELVARLLTRGSRSNPTPSSVSKKIEEIGAALQFTNDDERVRFTARCHLSVIDQLLEVIEECLTTPSFQQDQIDLVKAEMIAALDSERDETRTQAHRLVMASIYGEDKPYGRNSMGRQEDIPKISRDDVLSFYDEFYNPSSTLIVAAGNFDFSDLLSKIDFKLGGWNSGSKENQIPMPNSITFGQETGKFRTMPMNFKSQADISMGSAAVSRKSQEYYSLSLGNLLLGQIGLYGRLGKNIREDKGVAYYSFSSLVAKSYGGHIVLYAGVNPKNIEAAVEGMTEEMLRIQNEKIGEEELSTGKRNSIGSLAISLDTSSERVGIIHEIEYYSLGGSKYFEEYETKMNSISAEDIQKQFAKFLEPSRISMAIAGPMQNEKQLQHIPLKIMKDRA